MLHLFYRGLNKESVTIKYTKSIQGSKRNLKLQLALHTSISQRFVLFGWQTTYQGTCLSNKWERKVTCQAGKSMHPRLLNSIFSKPCTCELSSKLRWSLTQAIWWEGQCSASFLVMAKLQHQVIFLSNRVWVPIWEKKRNNPKS